MKQFLKNITNFLKRKAPTLALVAGVAIVCSLVMDIDLVSATTEISDTKAKTEESLGFLVSLLMQGLNLFLWPFLVILGDLMDNDLIIGPGMEDTLLSIWVQIRNLVNIGFAVFLLVIAFYNVLPLSENEGNLAIKTALPKLVLGLILVNFTFVGGKVLLDVANVGTTAAFALPELVEEFDFSSERDEFKYTVCWKEVTQGEEAAGGAGTYLDQWNTKTDKDDIPIYTLLFCELNEETGIYSGELNEALQTTYFEDLNVNNVGLVMAINMGALSSLKLLKDDAIDDFSDLVINSLFSLVMYFVMACSYVVLGLVLLARIVVLWVALAMSPVIVLFYVIPQLKEAVGSDMDLVGKVTKHLLAPPIIGLVLSVGYMMVSAIGDFGGISSMKASDLVSTEFLASGIDDMEKFVIAIASVVIIWTGVFAAASGTYAEAATGVVKGFGEKIGGAIAKAPLYATTVPIAVGENGETAKVSPMAIFGLADAATNNLQGQQRLNQQLQQMADESPFVKKLVGDIGGSSLRTQNQNAQRAADLARKDKLGKDEAKDLVESIWSTAKAAGASQTLLDQIMAEQGRAQNGNFAGLQAIINKNTAEQLGLDETSYGHIKTGLASPPTVGEVAADTAATAKGAAETKGSAPDKAATPSFSDRLAKVPDSNTNKATIAQAVAAAQADPDNEDLQKAADEALKSASV